MSKRTLAQTRKTLERVYARYPKLINLAVLLAVSEPTLRHWKALGCLNTVKCESVLHLSRLAKIPMEEFLVEKD